MAVVTLYNEGERRAELEVRGGREDEGRGLVFTVDQNNFLPCLTVSLAEEQAGTRLQYRPV